MTSNEAFSRSTAVLGEAAMEKLAKSHVAVFGLGGVGSFAAEALARSGVGNLTIVDKDTVSPTNLNRQLPALTSTIGQYKVKVMAARLLSINPALSVHPIGEFYDETTKSYCFAEPFDYVIDAIDDVSGKVSLAHECKRRNIPLISAMGTGNKLDPTAFRVTDVFSTQSDPLARVMRKKLRAAGIDKLKVVCSTETPRPAKVTEDGRTVPGSVSFVPPVVGFILAGEVIKDLIADRTK